MILEDAGSFAFGFVVGWITYRTLRRKEGSTLSDISTVIAALGGAAITAIFKTSRMFGIYSLGLFAGFFLYLTIALIMSSKRQVSGWMGELR